MTASPIEITWTVIAGVGVLLTGWMILDAYLDYRALLRAVRSGTAVIHGPRWWIAVGSLGGNSLTVLVWVGFLVVGMIAMQFPPPPPTPEQHVANAWAGWVLIAMEALLAATQVWMRVVRHQVMTHPLMPAPEEPDV